MIQEKVLNYLKQNDENTKSGKSFSGILGQVVGKWKIVKELSDGNVNYTFLVEGEKGKLIVKYAAEHIKVVKDWMLNPSRSSYEVGHLLLSAKWCKDYVPMIYDYSAEEAIIVMQYCQGDTLRMGLVGGNVYPLVAEAVSEYMAQTLFHTSDLCLKVGEKLSKYCSYYALNHELFLITDSLVFTEPFIQDCKNNNFDELLNDDVTKIQTDDELKLNVYRLKEKFRNFPQALCHGDLHTGSILVNETETFIIDPEFCFMGPMGFDIGLFLGNMLITYFCLREQNKKADHCLETVQQTWTLFEKKFKDLWNKEECGDLYNIDPKLRDDVQSRFFEKTFRDSLGYAGCAMVRRIIGLAACLDMKTLENQREVKIAAERKVLQVGAKLIKSYGDISENRFQSIAEVCKYADSLYITI